MKKLIKMALTLFVITAVVAGLLAGVNAITADRIAANKEQKTKDAIAAVLPGATDMTCVHEGQDMVRQVYEAGPSSPVQGWAVLVASAGFGGEIQLMVGIDHTYTVTGISIISHTETPGLGKLAADETPRGAAFRDSFVGKASGFTLEEIDALSGATITSQAVADGVSAALAFVKE